MVPNDFPRAVHRSLLLSCGIAETRRFWQQNPLQLDGRLLDPVALALHLADEDARSPMSWIARIMSVLELFLIEHDVPVDAFCNSLLVHANRGSLISSKVMLGLASPFMALLFRMGDPHRLCIRLCTLASGQRLPELIFGELGWRSEENNQRSAILVLGFRGLWERSIAAWDPSVFSAPLLRRMPVSLGLKPYDTLEPRADARTLEQIVDPARVEIGDGLCRIDRSPIGHLTTWNEHCQALGVSTEAYLTPNPQVVVIDHDWICPIRRRAVLVAGCAYAAPLYLFEARWQLDRERIHAVFQHLIHESVHGIQPPDEARARDLQQEFIADPRLPVRCSFNAREQSMYIDDECIVRGVPAIILRNCLREYCQSGRYQFSFREFKRDPQLISHPKNTGFEVRLRRLRERLEIHHCPIQIQTLGRGQFALRVHRVLVLDELSETAELQSMRRAPSSESPSDPSWS
jgi:hypothetical protein